MAPAPVRDGDVTRVRSARFSELTTAELYGILRLRSEVFVVEQQCAYLDLDDRDTDATTTHWWIEDAGRCVAVARLLRTSPGAGSRIGRVAVEAARRDGGLGTRVVDQALRVAPRPVRLDAQARVERWYGRFGFERDGDPFVEDGIPHVPMVLR